LVFGPAQPGTRLRSWQTSWALMNVPARAGASGDVSNQAQTAPVTSGGAPTSASNPKSAMSMTMRSVVVKPGSTL
jgi:hypothetical protein